MIETIQVKVKVENVAIIHQQVFNALVENHRCVLLHELQSLDQMEIGVNDEIDLLQELLNAASSLYSL